MSTHYIICPKCERGGAEHVGRLWYQCVWRDCLKRFRKRDAAEINLDKFKKFRDSIKPKTTMCDDMVSTTKMSISSSSSASPRYSSSKKLKYHPNRQKNTE